jgi:hypothetical protein
MSRPCSRGRGGGDIRISHLSTSLACTILRPRSNNFDDCIITAQVRAHTLNRPPMPKRNRVIYRSSRHGNSNVPMGIRCPNAIQRQRLSAALFFPSGVMSSNQNKTHFTNLLLMRKQPGVIKFSSEKQLFSFRRQSAYEDLLLLAILEDETYSHNIGRKT